MKSLLYITNLPAPYKIDFLNELGKYVKLTVAFERVSASDRNPAWRGNTEKLNFQPVWLKGLEIGAENSLDYGIVQRLRNKHYDLVLLNGYSSVTDMIAIHYMQRHGVPFGIVCDGMFIGQESCMKKKVKTDLIRSATFWLSPNDATKEALVHYGADRDRIYWYPFSSVRECDIVPVPYDRNEYKRKIGCASKYMILFVGQMIPRKGIDILLDAVDNISSDCMTYLIGGKLVHTPNNKHIVNKGFLSKNELTNYYKAADVFVLPSREDIWGLVVNEAMACGTPVIATDKCGAALAMINSGVNGNVIPANNASVLQSKINEILEAEEVRTFMFQAVRTAKAYTIEAMAKYIMQALQLNW